MSGGLVEAEVGDASPILTIDIGGAPGTDRGVGEAALDYNFQTGGYMPLGFRYDANQYPDDPLALDGKGVAQRFNLVELDSDSFPNRDRVMLKGADMLVAFVRASSETMKPLFTSGAGTMMNILNCLEPDNKKWRKYEFAELPDCFTPCPTQPSICHLNILNDGSKESGSRKKCIVVWIMDDNTKDLESNSDLVEALAHAMLFAWHTNPNFTPKIMFSGPVAIPERKNFTDSMKTLMGKVFSEFNDLITVLNYNEIEESLKNFVEKHSV